MTGERDLQVLLRTASPRRVDGEYVYTRLDPGVAVPAGAHPVVTVTEREGLTLVLPRAEADALGLPYGFVAAWITLEVHSALEAVGLTAAFSAALTREGIPANVVAGYTHDHVFVPVARASDALRALATLAGG
ncbi:MAG TPA: ACT domain-containing protein [Kineosporiaceae bacterium]|nr:ACT domain-containing protein [Kineosporiaceae bacterium]